MKRFLIISYWVVSILLVAIVLTSLGYRFLEALFIGSMFLPGALAAKYFFPKVNFKNRWAGIKDTVFIVLGILLGEMLLFMIAHRFLKFTFGKKYLAASAPGRNIEPMNSASRKR